MTPNQKRMKPAHMLAPLTGLGILCVTHSAHGDQLRDNTSSQPANRFANMSMADLLDVEITSASKNSESLKSVPAAIFVITAEDIRKSPAQTLPDLLKMVPGLEVAQLDGNKWAVGVRGGNERFAFDLLVLRDGRTLYSPFFSGVFWEQQDLLLDDIDRIEIIRGPGGSVWGANAVNGVINIITKDSGETQGWYAKAAVSNLLDQTYAARYGSDIKPDLSYRLTLKYRDNPATKTGSTAFDGWRHFLASGRADWQAQDGSKVLISGEFFQGQSQSNAPEFSFTPPYISLQNTEDLLRGGHLLARWSRPQSEHTSWSLQGFWDRAERDILNVGIRTDILDVEGQINTQVLANTRLTAGLGYRYIYDRIDDTPAVAFNNASDERDIASAFVQLEQTLFENETRLILGSKFEHNDFTGFEIQPSARLLVPVRDFNIWASASRSVRTFSRSERDGQVRLGLAPPSTTLNPSPLPIEALFIGSDGHDAEILTAYEAGVRGHVTPHLTVDFTAFNNRYTNVLDSLLGTPIPNLAAPAPFVTQPITQANTGKVVAKGFEAALTWSPREQISLKAFVGYLDLNVESSAPNAFDILTSPNGHISPRHQAGGIANVQLSDAISMTVSAKYTGGIERLVVDNYVDLDAQLTWQMTESTRLSVSGENLLKSPRTEFATTSLPVNGAKPERSVFGKIEVRF